MDKLRMQVIGILGGGGFSLPYSIDFSALGDGALPSMWVAPNGAISSGAAVNTPTLSADMYDPGAGTFESGIYSWLPYGTNTVVNDAGMLKVTFVDNANGANNTWGSAKDLNANLVKGVFYQLDYQAKVSAGADLNFTYNDGTASYGYQITQTELTSKLLVMPALITTCVHFFNGMGAGESVWLDNMVFRAASNVFWTLPPKASDVTIRAGLRIPVGSVGGLLINSDKAADQTPVNYVMLLVQRHTTYTSLRLITYKNGTMAQVYSNTIAYVDDALLEVRKSGTTYGLYYNNAQVGTNQTINDAALNNNQHHGVILPYGGNSLKSFFLGGS